MTTISKKTRLLVYEKFGGRCSYCGQELNGKFHVDHLIPIRRNWKYARDKNGRMTDRVIPDGCLNPEAETFENYMPACASCNINKHSMSLEEFRSLISGFMKHLNEVNTQYKIAKRYGLVSETKEEVKFYFELFEQDRL